MKYAVVVFAFLTLIPSVLVGETYAIRLSAKSPKASQESQKVSPVLRPLLLRECTECVFLGCTKYAESVISIPPSISESQISGLFAAYSVRKVSKADFNEIRSLVVFSSFSLGEMRLDLGVKYSLGEHYRPGGFTVLTIEEQITPSILKKISENQSVTYVEPDGLFYSQADFTLTPDAEERANSHFREDVNAPTTCPAGNPRPIVAVLDTGAQLDHKELCHNIWLDTVKHRGKNFSAGAAVGSDPEDTHGHGTSISGIIAGMPGNGGIVGMSWASELMIIKVLNPLPPDTDSIGGPGSGLAMAIDYAVENGARVINCSWTGLRSRAIYDAINRAKDKSLFVAAAGNGGYNPKLEKFTGIDLDEAPVYPACYPLRNMLCITSIDANGGRPSNRNYGSKTVTMCAPGEDIKVAAIGGAYSKLSGSSVAAACVSGAASLTLSFPRYTVKSPSELKKILCDNASRNSKVECLNGSLNLGFLAHANNSEAQPSTKPNVLNNANHPVPVQVSGRVEADWEIGGETSGYVLRPSKPLEFVSGSPKIELVLKSKEQFKAANEAIEEKSEMRIAGDFYSLQGTEVSRRHFIVVTSISRK